MSWRAALSLPVNVCRCVLCGSGVVGGWVGGWNLGGDRGWGEGTYHMDVVFCVLIVSATPIVSNIWFVNLCPRIETTSTHHAST